MKIVLCLLTTLLASVLVSNTTAAKTKIARRIVNRAMLVKTDFLMPNEDSPAFLYHFQTTCNVEIVAYGKINSMWF